MKTMGFWAVLGLAVLGTGCLTQVSTLQPFFADDEAIVVPEIAGSWLAEEGSSSLAFQRLEGPEYRMSVFDDGKKERGTLLVRFGRIGEDLYWDLTAQGSEREGLWGEHRLPIHSLARLRLEDDRLELAFLDAEWLDDAFEEARVELNHTTVADRLLLTASTSDLQRLLLEHGGDDGLFVAVETFHRQAAE